MEIVIKISEKLYKALKQDDNEGDAWNAVEAILSGTPLPKGHGALKDADEVMNLMERNFDMQELYLPIHFMQFAMDEAQTVIEADKEATDGSSD